MKMNFQTGYKNEPAELDRGQGYVGQDW